MRAVLVVALVAGHAWAGDRRAEVRFCNMTPDSASNEASKACVHSVEKQLAADYTELQRIGETGLRRQVGEASTPFMAWNAATANLGKKKKDPAASFDALVLIDCRPDLGRLDVVVASNTVARISLRYTVLDKNTLDLVGEQVKRRVWQGFSP